MRVNKARRSLGGEGLSASGTPVVPLYENGGVDGTPPVHSDKRVAAGGGKRVRHCWSLNATNVGGCENGGKLGSSVLYLVVSLNAGLVVVREQQHTSGTESVESGFDCHN